MKKLLLTFFAFLLFFQLYGQENVIIADLDDDFVNIDTIAPPQNLKASMLESDMVTVSVW